MKSLIQLSRRAVLGKHRAYATMHSQLTAEYRTVFNTARQFAEQRLMKVAGEIDRTGDIPNEVVQELGRLGFLGMFVPTKYGGAELDHFSYVLAMEEIGRGCASTAVMMTVNNSLYCAPVLKYGTEAQKEEFLTPYARGDSLGCFALTEPGNGSDASATSTIARLDGDSWVLNGTKAWISNAHDAGAAVVFATTDKSLKHKGITAFLVPMGARGVAVGRKESKLGIRGSSTGQITFTDVRIPKANVLGKVGQGFKIAMVGVDGVRIGVAGQALGIAQASVDLATKYALERKAFGIAISKLYAIQKKLSTMACSLEGARLLTWRAAVAKDTDEVFARYAAMAKLCASESATLCSHQAIQILGAMGFVSEMPAERYYRDARVTEIYGGTSEIQHLVIANCLLNQYQHGTCAFPAPPKNQQN